MKSIGNGNKNRWFLVPVPISSFTLSPLTPPHSQAIRDAIDVIEPTGDQVDLQDGLIVEAHPAQSVEVLGRDPPGMARQFRGVIEHCPIGVVEGGLSVVPPQRGGEFLVQRNALEELGMAFYSVKTAI
jgi:hypothetical protein